MRCSKTTSRALFVDGDVHVLDAREDVRERRQLVVVRGEERPRGDFLAVVEELDHGPGDGHAVERARPAADLIEDDERIGRRVVEDLGGLHHLDHEGRLAGREVVLGADAA